jgi:hypothetical protein
LAILVGIGFGWIVSGLFAPATHMPQASTEAAPVSPGGRPAQLAAPAETAGPPINLAISNRDCEWGPDFDGYYQQAADLKAQIERREGREVDRIIVRVPGRSWRGLTVGGVAALHGGAGIIFEQSPDNVRAALHAAGVRVETDGRIPLTGDLADVIGQAVEATPEGSDRYGATMLTCGS